MIPLFMFVVQILKIYRSDFKKKLIVQWFHKNRLVNNNLKCCCMIISSHPNQNTFNLYIDDGKISQVDSTKYLLLLLCLMTLGYNTTAIISAIHSLVVQGMTCGCTCGCTNWCLSQRCSCRNIQIECIDGCIYKLNKINTIVKTFMMNVIK